MRIDFSNSFTAPKVSTEIKVTHLMDHDMHQVLKPVFQFEQRRGIVYLSEHQKTL